MTFPMVNKRRPSSLLRVAQVYFNVDANDWVDAGDQDQDHDRGTVDLRQISAPLAEKFLSGLTRLPGS
jgi:hypothetical protein